MRVDMEGGGHVAGAQAVVAADVDGVGEARERPRAVVVEEARLAVHGGVGAGNGASRGVDERLMAETDAENGNAASGERDEVERAAGFLRSAGAGGLSRIKLANLPKNAAPSSFSTCSTGGVFGSTSGSTGTRAGGGYDRPQAESGVSLYRAFRARTAA